MISIFKREFNAYFHSMTGFVFLAFMTFASGIYFMAYNMVQGYPYFSAVLSSTWFIFMIGIPFLTMRSFAEERHTKTDQLLLTSPVSLGEIVLGKYLAMVCVFGCGCLILALGPLMIEMTGEGHLIADYAALLAYFIQGCLLIAVGMMVSACTESQILSAVGTFLIMLVFYLWSSLVEYLPTSAFGSLVCFLVVILFFCWVLQKLFGHFMIPSITALISSFVLIGTYLVNSSAFENSFVNAVSVFSMTTLLDTASYYYLIDVQTLVQVGSMTIFLIFLTVQILARRRWC